MNLLHQNRNNIDIDNYHTFEPWDKLSISTCHQVFHCNTQSTRVNSAIQVTKHELVHICFLNMDCTYEDKDKTESRRGSKGGEMGDF